MDQTEPMVFNEVAPEVPVEIKGKKYLLRSATSDAATKWQNKSIATRRYVEDAGGGLKLFSLVNVADLEPLLVSSCLFEVSEGGKERPVTLVEVGKFDAKITSALFKRAEEISGLRTPISKENLLKAKAEIEDQLAEMEKKEQDLKN